LTTLDITNIGTEVLRNVRYRRVMDWDIDPTEFSDLVLSTGIVPVGRAHARSQRPWRRGATMALHCPSGNLTLGVCLSRPIPFL
jgi:hypothetical protein